MDTGGANSFIKGSHINTPLQHRIYEYKKTRLLVTQICVRSLDFCLFKGVHSIKLYQLSGLHFYVNGVFDTI